MEQTTGLTPCNRLDCQANFLGYCDAEDNEKRPAVPAADRSDEAF